MTLPWVLLAVALLCNASGAPQHPFNPPTHPVQQPEIEQNIELREFGIGSDRFKFSHTNAWINAAGFSITPPGSFAALIHSKISAKQYGSQYIVNCTTLDTLPDMLLDFNPENDLHYGRVTLKSEEYLIRVGGNCISPFIQLIWEATRVPGVPWVIARIFLDKDEQSSPTDALITEAPVMSLQPVVASLPAPEEMVNLLGFSFGPENVMLDDTLAIIDPASFVIIMPVDIARHFNIKISAYQQDGYLHVNCDDVPYMPTLVFYLASNDDQIRVDISAEEYIVRVGGHCLSPFTGMYAPRGPSWRIGNAFLHRYQVPT